MGLFKRRLKLVAVLAAAGLAAAGWFIFRPESNTTITTTQPVTNQTTQVTSTEKGADPQKAVYIEVEDFEYEKPAGWAEIAKNTLVASGANSGIGRPIEPVATFTVKVTSDAPSNDEIRKAVLDGPQKLPNFVLATSTGTKVDNQAGQKFVYSFTDSKGENKSTQEMNVVVYNKKTFLLLFHTPAADYAKQINDFSAILNSFKFK